MWNKSTADYREIRGGRSTRNRVSKNREFRSEFNRINKAILFILLEANQTK